MKATLTTMLLCCLVYCSETTDIDICNSEQGRFIDDTHYVESKFVTEDNTWNYKTWNKYRERASKNEPNPNCIPPRGIKGAEREFERENTEERIQRLEEEIDLKR